MRHHRSGSRSINRGCLQLGRLLDQVRPVPFRVVGQLVLRERIEGIEGGRDELQVLPELLLLEARQHQPCLLP